MNTIKTTLTQKSFRVLLGLFMVFAGISHLTFNRFDFQAQVPDWLPLNSNGARLGHLFFQPVLIVWVLWSSGVWKALSNRKSGNKKLTLYHKT